MGICASSQYSMKKVGTLRWPHPTTKIIHPDGKLQELRQPVKASLILSQNPSCFLCNSELMYINSPLPHVPGDELLQLDQIYFLLPLSKFEATLSLQELCLLAIKASEYISLLNRAYSSQKISPFSYKRCCKVGTGFKYPVRSGNRIVVF
ncbi:hypothetical protein Golob_002990 [Gossypium lobatum]|uniref:Uncharacterized protein n=1 Tax=Gossypium lobatum TaxID=34289 RepID=A0A7J8N740_9ROSI|nr:hypothetical protein [Gossypium lobatum]